MPVAEGGASEEQNADGDCLKEAASKWADRGGFFAYSFMKICMFIVDMHEHCLGKSTLQATNSLVAPESGSDFQWLLKGNFSTLLEK